MDILGIIASSQPVDTGPVASVLTFISSYFSSENDVATHDFTSVPFGDYTPDRQVHVVVCVNADAAGDISCEIGDDASPVADTFQKRGTEFSIYLFRGAPTGTDGTITINSTANFDDLLISVYTSTGSVVPFEANGWQNRVSVSKLGVGIEVPDGGFVIAGAISAGSAGDGGAHTWVGITKDAERGGGNFFSTNLAGCASSASLSAHEGQGVDNIYVGNSEFLATCIAAVAYGVAEAVPSIAWAEVFRGNPEGVVSANLAGDTVRSRLDVAQLSNIPSNVTHIRVTTYAHSSGAFAADKSYVGNGATSPNTDADDLVQLLFGEQPEFDLAVRDTAVSDPAELAYAGDDLQFSYLVNSDEAKDSPSYQTFGSCPWSFKADVDEADDLAVTGYGGGDSIQFLAVLRVEFGVAN